MKPLRAAGRARRILAAAFVAVSGKAAAPKASEAALPRVIARSAAEGFDVRPDPRIELLAVVQLLARADRRFAGFHRHDIPYARAASERFAPFRGHPVVEHYEAMMLGGADYVKLRYVLARLSNPPELSVQEPIPRELARSLGGEQAVEELRLLLSDFARAAGFEAFYGEMKGELEGMAREVAEQAARSGAFQALGLYLGRNVRLRFTILVSPFAEPALGLVYDGVDQDGTPHLWGVYGPETIKGVFQFRFPTRRGNFWSLAADRELADRTPGVDDRLRSFRPLYRGLQGACAQSWRDCGRRHLAFAVAGRLAALSGDPTASEWAVKYARVGLPYLGPLMERLKEYEADRNTYPTLEDFYPRLAEVFEALASSAPAGAPFSGDIASLARERGPAAFVLAGGPGQDLRRARRAAARLWPQAELVAGGQAWAEGSAGRTLIVAGTWAGRGIRGGFKELPLRLSGGDLELMQRYDDYGRDHRFSGRLAVVSVAPHPSDPSRGALLYAASDAELLAALMERPAPAADFAVYDGTAALKVGFYEKTRLPWRVK